MKKDKEWLKEEVKTLFDEAYDSGKMEYYESEESIHRINSLVDQLEEPEKPVIPQFVADWIDDYRDHGGLIIDMLGSLTTELDSASSIDNEVTQWFRENTEKMLKALMDMDGYEVEKEKLYRVRAGNRYVRFNLDGSIIGVRKENSIVCLERLSKLPFDYKKAVESGIITLEEVIE